MIATPSPVRSVRSTLSSASTPGNRFVMPRISRRRAWLGFSLMSEVLCEIAISVSKRLDNKRISLFETEPANALKADDKDRPSECQYTEPDENSITVVEIQAQA